MEKRFEAEEMSDGRGGINQEAIDKIITEQIYSTNKSKKPFVSSNILFPLQFTIYN